MGVLKRIDLGRREHPGVTPCVRIGVGVGPIAGGVSVGVGVTVTVPAVDPADPTMLPTLAVNQGLPFGPAVDARGKVPAGRGNSRMTADKPASGDPQPGSADPEDHKECNRRVSDAV